MRDFDDNDFPLGYLITFRCYGTWLHGDKRGSMDRKYNVYGAPKIAPNPHLERSDSTLRKQLTFVLNARQRKLVETAVREVCDCRKYILRAINVRTNHRIQWCLFCKSLNQSWVHSSLIRLGSTTRWLGVANYQAVGASRQYSLSLEGARCGKSNRLRIA